MLPSLQGGEGKVDYSREVQPLLAAKCYHCHGPDASHRKADLRLDERTALLKFVGEEGQRALVPGKPEESELMRRIETHDEDERMPRNAGNRLSGAEIATLRRWIQEGAPFAPFWAFEAPQQREPPAVTDPGWCRNDIDRFIFAALEAKRLKPAAEADRAVLLRRLSFDLTGLPPSPAELKAFLDDPAPGAWERQVERLLASPAYGEKWAGHWLDLARYAESYGHEFDFEMHAAWRYRDYLVRAFNADLPYDQLLREQIAGDLLPEPRCDPVSGANESVLGPAFLRLGEDMHSPTDILVHQSDRVDNIIDTFSKTFHGLTVACARCHDHKFDPISQKDYTALFGIFASSRYALQPVEAGPAREARLAEARAAKARLPLPAPLPQGAAPSPLAEVMPLPAPGKAAGWSSIGLPLDEVLASPGSIAPGLDAAKPVSRRWLSRGVDSALLGRAAEVQVRSPDFDIRRRFLHVRAAGEDSRLRACIEGFKMIRDPLNGQLHRHLEDGAAHWLSFDLEKWLPSGGIIHHAYLEVLDCVPADPASPHPQAYGDQGWFALDAVVFSDSPRPPELAAAWDLPSIPPVEAAPFAAWQKAAAGLGQRQWCLGTADGSGRDYHLPLRGSPRAPGELVPRRGLAVLSGDQAFSSTGSGRLELAESLLTPRHPLTSRVLVNRLWHQLFGRGLVASTDNFGVLGDRPSHPELLDHLALRLEKQDRWSIKAALRRIVCSRSYRMSSRADAQSEEIDPGNLLLHRQNLRRLPAESLRDALLAVSGRLDPRLGGPPVPVWLDQNGEGRGKPKSGPVDGEGRRSLYLSVRRNFPSTFLYAFDRPQPSFTVGRRSVTQVPAQSLAMMNDPLVHELSGKLGERILKEASDENSRFDLLFRLCLSRSPDAAEVQAMKSFLAERRHKHDEESAWTALAHAALQLKEFIFLH
ncbi:MAG: hypothetical protein RL095_3191 [Verrucomicrobiota bacterium]